jgi:hypothetical protein
MCVPHTRSLPANTLPPPGPNQKKQIDTTMGSFTVELYYKHAPKTVDNFVKLADKGYYDGTVFHRIIRDFSAFLAALLFARFAVCLAAGFHTVGVGVRMPA